MISKTFAAVASAALITSLISQSLVAAPRVIEEVLVTANKKTESAQDVPLSISVVDAEFIVESGFTEVGEITRYIPNVSFDASLALFTTIIIRGFGTPPLGVGFEPSIGLVIDDIPYGRSTYAQDAVFDIDRLEVLRGPQGTLFGKNTLGGVLNFHTTEPTEDFEGYVTVNHGQNVESTGLEAAVSGALIDSTLLGRLALRVRDADTLEYNSTRDEQQTQEDLGVRLKLDWLVSDRITARFGALYSKAETVGYTQSLDQASERSLRVFREYDPEVEDDAFDQNTSTDGPTKSDREVKAVFMKMSYVPDTLFGLESPELLTILSYSQVKTPYSLDVDYSPVNLVNFNEPPRGNPYSTRSAEFRFSGTASAPFGWGEGLDFVVGLFAAKSKNNVFQDIDVDLNGLIAFGRAGAIVQNQQAPFDPFIIPVGSDGLVPPGQERERFISGTSSETTSYALFSQFNWLLTDRLSLTFGIRYGEDEAVGGSFSQVAEGNNISGGSLNQSNYDEQNLEIDETSVSPKLAINYEVLDGINVYANAAKGFKAGGLDPAPLNDNALTYEGEEAITYEIGLKSRLLGGSLTMNLAVFDTEVENLQIRTFNGVTLTTSNAPESSSKGAEFDFFWLPPIDGTSMAGSIGYLDAQYDHFPNGPPLFRSGSDPGQDLAGKPLPYAPQWTASLSPKYEWPMSKGELLGNVRLNASFTDGRFLDSDIDPNTFQPRSTRIDVGFGLKSADNRWNANFQARNVTKIKDSILILDQPLLPGNYTRTPLPDHTTFQLDLRYNFGAGG